jgi:hypothetical protein
MKRWLATAALVPAMLSMASTALGSSSYPDAMKSHLGLSSTPACTLCHEGSPGFGTVTTPFGATAKGTYGLVAQDTTKLATVLNAMAKDKADSDGDGTPDIDELKAGTDPNAEGNITAVEKPELIYGCQARIAGEQRSGAAAAAFLSFALAAGIARRRRRRLGMGGALVTVTITSLLVAGCYDVSFVASEVCASGLAWTGGDKESPNMHPGAACIKCHHDQEGPSFQIAGTVFPGPGLDDDCFGSFGVEVLVTGADGKSVKMSTTESGNFYTELPVKMPYRAEVIVGDKRNTMVSEQSNGDCNSCHTVKGESGAPGRIVLP